VSCRPGSWCGGFQDVLRRCRPLAGDQRSIGIGERAIGRHDLRLFARTLAPSVAQADSNNRLATQGSHVLGVLMVSPFA
jgi:hypothetical protein